MAEDTPKQEEKQEPELELIRCPCCGKQTLTKPLNIPGDVLDEYMSCIISGTPFSHTYPVYNGSIEITVTALTKQDMTRVESVKRLLIDLMRFTDAADPAVSVLAQAILNTVRVYSSITTITVYRDKKILKTYAPSGPALEACDKITAMQAKVFQYMDNSYQGEDKNEAVELLKELQASLCSPDVLSTVPDDLLHTVVRTHSDLYNILLISGFDENFWKGIELA